MARLPTVRAIPLARLCVPVHLPEIFLARPLRLLRYVALIAAPDSDEPPSEDREPQQHSTNFVFFLLVRELV